MRLYLLAILLLIYSCKPSSQEIEKKEPNFVLFGKVKNNSFEYVIDTLTFKKSISNQLFSKESKGDTYDKLEIKKAITLGESREEYYYVILYHYQKRLKTVRFLENHSSNLYLNENSVFNTIYNSCVGKDEKCFPNVVINSDLTKAWICSDKVGVCSIDENECKSVRSIIQD